MREEQDALSLKNYLGVASLFILANVTQPLLGAVDTAVLGKLSSPIYMAGAAVGIAAFNTLYWLFGFLRMVATVSCIEGIEKKGEKCPFEVLIRMLGISLIEGIVIIALQKPIWAVICQIARTEAIVREQASIYCSILVWGVPFVLMGYVMLGWLMGRKRIKTVVIIQLISNVANFALDFILVKRVGMGVRGVAITTLYIQILIFVLGLICVVKEVIPIKNYISSAPNWPLIKMEAKLKINWDIVIRTLCILTVHNTVIAVSSRLGTNILATNSILIQIQCFMTYVYEGLANASRIFTRRSKNQEDLKVLKEIQRMTLSLSMYVGFALVIIYMIFRLPIMNFFTNIEIVQKNIKCFDGWFVVFPIIAGWGLSAYGLYVGRMYTSPIKKTNILALILFGITLSIILPFWGNHGLWFALILFYAGRSIFLLGAEGELYTEEETGYVVQEEHIRSK